MIAVSYEQILQWQTKGFDPHRFSYHIPQEELLQAMLDLTPKDLSPTDTIVGEDDYDFHDQTGLTGLEFKVYAKEAMKIFNCGRTTLSQGDVPGVSWLGRQPHRGLKAVVKIDLSHPILSKAGLTYETIEAGVKAFYTIAEASKIVGISTSHGYKHFKEQTIKFGTSNRIPVGGFEPLEIDDSAPFLKVVPK